MTGRMVGTFLVLLSAAVFAAIAVAAKYVYAEGGTPETLLCVRFGVAAVVLWIYLLLRGRSTLLGYGKTVGFFGVGGLLYGGMSLLLFAALVRIPVSMAVMLLYTFPAMVAVLSTLLLGERMTIQKVVALVLCLAGTVLILGGPVGGLDTTGVLLGLGSAVAYAFYVVFGSALLANEARDRGFAYLMISTAVVVTFYGAIGGSLDFGLSLGATALLVAIGLGTAVAVTSFFTGLRQVGTTRAAIISTFEPVVAAILSVSLLAEVMTSRQIVGGLLILSAVVILNWRIRSSRQELVRGGQAKAV